MRILSLAISAAAFWVASQADATVINFDNLGTWMPVSTQYPGVVFSSSSGERLLTVDQAADLGSSPTNFICTAAAPLGGCDGTHDLYVDFSNGVSGLSFLVDGADSVGKIADLHVYAGATLLAATNINGLGHALIPILVDLSAYTGITRIEVTNVTDPRGIGYDDFMFTTGKVPAVPEPGTWAMMLLGFGGISFAMRRKRGERALAQIA